MASSQMPRKTAPPPSAARRSSLTGIRVIEVGQNISTPFCGKLLTDLGAEVIKIEPLGGDALRTYGPFPGDWPDAEASGLFIYLNAGKKSITLDLSAPTGKRVTQSLLEEADVLLIDAGDAKAAGWIPDWEPIGKTNPKLIVTSVSVFGKAGPHAHYQGGGLQAAAGSVAYHLGDPDRTPLIPPVREAEYWGGLQACAATMTALYWRLSSGKGQEIDISTMESLSTLVNGHRDLRAVRHGMVASVGFGGDTPRQGYHGWLLPWVILPCKDGYVVIMSSSVRHWQRYLGLMDDQPWTADHRILNLDRQWIERKLGFDTLDAYQMQWLGQRTRKDLFHLFGKINVPYQPVHKIDEVVDSQHIRHRRFLKEVKIPGLGFIRMPGLPFHLPAAPAQTGPSPRLGEHNQEVLGGLLGLCRHECAAMRGGGIA